MSPRLTTPLRIVAWQILLSVSVLSSPARGQVPPLPNPVDPAASETDALSAPATDESFDFFDEMDADSIDLGTELRRLQARIEQLENAGQPSVPSEIKAAPAFPTFKITGFTQFDSALYSQEPENIATVGDAQDGSGFRRARIAVIGMVAESTFYQVEMDFAVAGRPSFFDTFVEQRNLPHVGAVKIGQFCQPFSVDAQTGFRNLTFLERSLPFLALVPFRRIGAEASDTNEDQTTAWAYSVYRSGGFNNAPLGDDRFATDFGDLGGYAVSGRLTHLVWYDECAADRYLCHIGGGYNFSVLGANDAIGSGTAGNAGSPRPFYQARAIPEFRLGYPELSQPFGSAVNTTPVFVDTGRYEADDFHLFGLETVCQAGPWGFTAEYIATSVDSVVGPVFYQGGYAQLAYRLTGEHRVYDTKTGTLGKLVPFTDFIPLKRDGIKGWGAWEVAARWSVIDLRNPDDLDGHYYDSATNTFTGTSKAGNGVLNDSTIGLTWFLNVHTKVQFNWIHAMLDNSAKGFSTADLFVTRVQVDF
jgi:phosphate-selective porin OprO/OprP